MKKLSPYLIIVLSFLILILIGTFLLYLPVSNKGLGTLKFIDAFFTSVSAVTLTGLSPVSDLGTTLTTFGKVVVMILVQIGGLSVVTFSVFIMYLIGYNIGISNRVLIKESFNQDNLSGMVKLVVKIVIYTFVLQFISFIINLFIYLGDYSLLKAIGVSLYQAINSFNNAGFNLFTTGIESSSGNLLLNLNTMIMVILGGLGFIVVNDIYEKRSYKKLSLHSKIVLKVNLVLWIFGMLIFKLGEANDFTWFEALFLSVSARTAGYTIVDIGAVSALTTFVLMFLMFIGGSPGSAASGLKTTTFYTLIKGVTSYGSGKQVVSSKRLIDKTARDKASLLLTTALSLVVFGTIGILMFEDVRLENALFEVMSAFSNAGFTKGLVVSFSNISKLLITLLMFAGRVGPLTLLSIFNNKWYKREFHNIEYIEENIMIG